MNRIDIRTPTDIYHDAAPWINEISIFDSIFFFTRSHTVADVHNMESLEQLFRSDITQGLEEFSAFISLITRDLQLNSQLQDEVIWKRNGKGACKLDRCISQ
jgi:hypothetical protein